MTRQQAWELLRRYNAEPFHLRHALTVEGAILPSSAAMTRICVGLLHDIDLSSGRAARVKAS